MNIDNTLEMSNRKSPRQPQQPYNMFNAQDNRSPIDIDVSAPVDQQTINASLMFAEPLRSLADLLSVPALQFYQRAFVSLGYGDLLTLLSLHETQWTSVLEEVALEALKSSGIEMLPAHRQLIFSRLKTEKMRRDTITKQHYDKTFLTDQATPNQRNPNVRIDRTPPAYSTIHLDKSRANRRIFCEGLSCFQCHWITLIITTIISISAGFTLWAIWRSMRSNSSSVTNEGVWRFVLAIAIIFWALAFICFFGVLVIIMTSPEQRNCHACAKSFGCDECCLPKQGTSGDFDRAFRIDLCSGGCCDDCMQPSTPDVPVPSTQQQQYTPYSTITTNSYGTRPLHTTNYQQNNLRAPPSHPSSTVLYDRQNNLRDSRTYLR